MANISSTMQGATRSVILAPAFVAADHAFRTAVAAYALSPDDEHWAQVIDVARTYCETERRELTNALVTRLEQIRRDQS